MKSLDDSAGSLYAALEQMNLLNDTIIIYTSDQGYFLGEHGYWDKRFMYEESIRMPFLVRYPSLVKAGSECDRIVLNTDIGPTLLDLAGVPVPDDMDGRSMKQLLAQTVDQDWRQSMYYHFYEHNPKSPWHVIDPHYGIRTERYKLIHFYPIDDWELYDLKKDPLEQTNRYRDPEYGEVVNDLKAQLKVLRQELNDS